jgi:hypothetical protein
MKIGIAPHVCLTYMVDKLAYEVSRTGVRPPSTPTVLLRAE